MVLKKKFSTLITLLVCLFASVGLMSCGGNESTEPNTPNESTPEEPKTALESLNTTERAIYNSIIIEMYNYKDPSSVLVQSIPCEYWNAAVEINIQGKNDYGSNVSYEYLYFFEDATITDLDMSKYSTASVNSYGEVPTPDNVIGTVQAGRLLSMFAAEAQYEENPFLSGEYAVVYQLFHWQKNSGERLSLEISTSKINAALKEYKQAQGWA